MRQVIVALSVLSVALLAAPAFAQKAKAPVTKVAKVEVKAPASQPAAVKVEVKAPASQPVVASAAPQPTATASTTTTEEMPWWKVLIRYMLELVFTLLGAMGTVLVTVLARKYGFEDYSAKINDVLGRGIGFAEQKSLQAVKVDGKPLGSAAKLNLALDFIVVKAKEYKLPDKGKDWWEKKVEGWLGMQSMSNGSPVATPNKEGVVM